MEQIQANIVQNVDIEKKVFGFFLKNTDVSKKQSKGQTLKWLLKYADAELKLEQSKKNPWLKPSVRVIGSLYDQWNFSHYEKLYLINNSIQFLNKELAQLEKIR